MILHWPLWKALRLLLRDKMESAVGRHRVEVSVF
jgi:hypothetical protein